MVWLSDVALGGAIAAAVGGFAVLLAIILILVYLLRARRRRQRLVQNSTSSSISTYSQHFNDDRAGAAISGSQLDSVHAVASSGGRRASSVKVVVGQDDASTETDTFSGGTTPVFTVSGSGSAGRQKPRYDGEHNWPPLEPNVYVADTRLWRCSTCQRPRENFGSPASCMCDRVTGYDVTTGSRSYGCGNNVGMDFVEHGATGSRDDRRHRSSHDDVVWRTPSYTKAQDGELFAMERRHHHPQPIATTSRPDFTMLSTAFLGAPLIQEHRSIHSLRIVAAGDSSTPDSPVYARVERRTWASNGEPSPSSPPSPGSTSRSSSRRLKTESGRSSVRRSSRRRRKLSADGIASTTVAAAATELGRPQPVNSTSSAADGQSQPSAAVRSVQRTRIRTTTSPKKGNSSGRLSAEYCTRVVDEAFGAIVNPAFDVETS